MEQYIYLGFFILSILVMIVYLYKTHKKWVITVCLRAVCSIVLILVLNWVFELCKINCNVGVNVITITVASLLGVPGMLLIYGSVYFFTHN